MASATLFNRFGHSCFVRPYGIYGNESCYRPSKGMPVTKDSPQSGTVGQTLWVIAKRQFSLPSWPRSLIEIAMFAGVFVAASKISLQMPYSEMLAPMLTIVTLMMVTMIASGVFREDITNCIINLYVHSAYGFLLATMLLLPVVLIFLPQLADGRFIFFFLFFAFFVTGALRPLVSGTDFMDGGGRRIN